MFDHYSNEPVFNVKAISHQTGVAAATLRAWERRYGVPSPPRTDSGYRLYSARDVAIIRWLKSQIENGMSISQAVQLLQSVEAHSTDGQGEGKGIANALPSSYLRLHDDIVAAAAEFDEETIEHALSEAFSLFAVEDVCLNVVQPVLITLGDQWHTGQINVSIEHFATNIMRRRLLALMAASPSPSRTTRIVSACAPEEYHEIGILMLSLFMRRSGYSVVYLGQSISATRLEEMLSKTHPDVLLLSASGLLSAANLLEVTVELRKQEGNSGLMVAFGGSIFNRVPSLHKRVSGLYVGEDAEKAVLKLTELTANTKDRPFQADAPTGLALADAVTAYRLRRAEVISLASKLAEARFGSEFVHRTAAEAHHRLTHIIDAAIRLNEPSLLGNVVNWKWDALPPDGISMPQLKLCVDTLVAAMQAVLPEQAKADLQPFFAQLEQAFDETIAEDAATTTEVAPVEALAGREHHNGVLHPDIEQSSKQD